MSEITLENQLVGIVYLISADFYFRREIVIFGSEQEFLEKMVKEISEEYNLKFFNVTRKLDSNKKVSQIETATKNNKEQLIIFFTKKDLSGNVYEKKKD